MPPKRVSRSTRASAEPQQPISKRKRTDPADGDELAAEQENLKSTLRPTRRTGGTTAAPARKASSTRASRALQEVQKDEEDAEDGSPRPLKRARSSNEYDPHDKIDEVLPSRAVRSLRPRGLSAKEPIVIESSDDEPPPPVPPPKNRKPPSRKASATPSSRGTTPRASRSVSRAIKAEPQVEPVAEEDEYLEPPNQPPVKAEPPKRATRTSTASSHSTVPPSKAASKAPEPSVKKEGEDEQPQKPTKKSPSRRRIARSTRSSQPPASSASRTEPMEESEAETAAPKRIRKPKISIETADSSEAGPCSPGNKLTSPNAPVEDEDEDDISFLNVPLRTPKKEKVRSPTRPSPSQPQPMDYEEKSLLDSLNQSPRKSALPPPPIEEPSGPVSRLTIYKLALVNFKSYAGRQEIGPFHKSFSAIVGPNGSGKSNTIDALLFVFGYRASKMRQGKLSELIHNSAQFPDLDECSVEVHFRDLVDLPGPDDYEVVANTDLIVTRTAFKNNQSKYTINGRVSTYKEVQALLKGRGIDLDHNRFLILQGEVESIAQMKPKAPSEHEDGLLEYLEDIIGTSQYKPDIEKALEELERLQDERTERMSRLRFVENEKAALEKEKKAAEQYLRCKNDHTRAQSRYWQWIIWQCLQNEAKYNQKIAKLDKVLGDEREKNKDNIEAQERFEAEYDQRNEDLDNLKKAMKAASDDLKKHENEEVKLQAKHSQATARLSKLQKSFQDDAKSLKAAQRAIKDNAAKITTETQNAEQLERDLRKEEKVLEDICESIKDKTKVFSDEIEKKQRELQPWTAKIQQKQAEIDVRVSERDMLVKKDESAKQALQEAEATLQSLQTEQVQKMKESANLKDRRKSLQQEKAASERHQRDLNARVDDLRKTASSHRQRTDEARSSQASARSGNQVLNALNSLASSGRIYGFHGRLGGLGTIDAKYDVAISTACSQLNNMVVDTVEQGQQCLDYLRKQNVGRASFMVLEKLTGRPSTSPAPLPRLYDLVTPREDHFAPAFWKALGNTLVARDIDEANRVAIGGKTRWRVVTLDGQLVDSSGTMSGGGTSVARGGMSDKFASQTVSPNELRKLEQDAERATAQLQEAQEELRRIEAKLDELQHEGPQIDMDIRKLELDVENTSRRIADSEKSVQELRAQSKPNANDQKRISNLKNEIAEANAALENLVEQAGVIEQAIKDLNKKVEEAGGSRLLVQRSKVEGLRTHINIANEEVTKAEVAAAKAEKDVQRLTHAIEGHGENIGRAEGEVAQWAAELEEVQSKVNEYKETVENATMAVDEAKDKIGTLKAELEEKTELTRAFRKHELELKQQQDDIRKEAESNIKLLEEYSERHDSLTLEDIDDDDDEEETADAENGDENGEVLSGAQESESSKSRNGRDRAHSLTLPEYKDFELAKMNKDNLLADLTFTDDALKKLKPNPTVLKEYRKREEEFLRRAKDLEDTTAARDAQKQKYDALCKQRLDLFMGGFSTISLKLKEMYQMITLGGNAELELVDSMDPFSEGIIFSVMPPKKSWRNISNLSGGEKTLSSLALVFALHVYKPTPLYFMDEIDAALDFRNVSIVANYIKDRTKNAQFIIISLRNDMFELSQRLIGIYKVSNQTRSVSIDNRSLHGALAATRVTATPAPPPSTGPFSQ